MTTLSPYDQREKLALAGDVHGLFEQICRVPWTTLDAHTAFQQLRKAIDVASRRDPADFGDELFREMLAFSTFAMLRVQYLLVTALEQFDLSGQCRPSTIPREVLDLHPHLIALQTHVAQLAHARASVARLWGLCRRRLSNTEPGTSGGDQRARVQTRRGTSRLTKPSTNGHRRRAAT